MDILEAQKKLQDELKSIYPQVNGSGIDENGIVIYLKYNIAEPVSNTYEGYNVRYSVIGEIR